MAVKPQEFECSFNESEDYSDCSLKKICKMKGTDGFDFQQKEEDEYLNNWFVSMNFECESPTVYN